MPPLDPQQLIGPTITRRQFLSHSARVAAGAALAPALLLPAACQKPADSTMPDDQKPVEGPKEEKPATHVLRAGRFTAAPDGRSREIWGYDGQLPGPLIRAKEGDLLRIKVVNALGVPTSIHWHGMHQPGSWQMDGVEEVSRPPIPTGAEFIYEFRATPAGTHWYHSHVGVQYGNGLFGPLIVEGRTPIAGYDREEILILNDWFLELGDSILAKLAKGAMMKMPPKINTKAMKDVADVPFQSALINGKGRAPGDTKGSLTTVAVKRGETLRLRLINGSSTYAFRFQIDGHPLSVIASDGAAMQPVPVDNLLLSPGERYDVLLKADQEGVHWVRAATLDGKEARAILRYAGAQAAEPEAAPSRWGDHALALEAMRSREPVCLADKPREIPLTLGGSMKPYRWDINGQYYPKADPIVLDKDEPVRFVFHNPTGMDHPFHLHGHYFYVLGKPGSLNLKDPVQKDTVNVPAKSDLVIEWQAKNPGRWFFHCHIEWHLATGMARVVEIKPY
jgi:FtsP/CotA-like multicopper oxidase with cupredoxin domain